MMVGVHTPKAPALVQHSSDEDDHGTPPEWVELARHTLGGIDLDPTSSAYWNHWIVNARVYYDEQMDALKQPWFGRMFCNFPSNRARKISVRPFWEKLCIGYRDGSIDSAVYIGFTLEQLSTLQGAPMHPLQFICHFPAERIPFMQREGGGPPSRSTSPTHANFVALLPSRASAHFARQQLRNFLERCSSLELRGATTRPMV